jgi:nitroreductase
MISRTSTLIFYWVGVTIGISRIQNVLGFGGLFAGRRARRAQQAAGQFQDLLLNRRTIDEFKADLPSNWEESLETAIRAATYAPNHKRTEPWRFHLLGNETIRNVCELNAQIVADKKGDAAGKKKLKRWLAMPGWLVVTCQKSSDSEDMKDPMGLCREDYAACCCAVQNLCLSLHASGLGTKWTTGPVNFDSRFSGVVGLSDSEFVVGTIWFGTPVSQPTAPKKKLGFNDVLIRHS